jgi:hypothetical protein
VHTSYSKFLEYLLGTPAKSPLLRMKRKQPHHVERNAPGQPPAVSPHYERYLVLLKVSTNDQHFNKNALIREQVENLDLLRLL